jgi:shikimate 5-dehydrogenase/shikimate kinase
MHIFLIGHRGTGKTSLLQRLQIYGRGGFPVVDLDREIEKKQGRSISEIFHAIGEREFRELEKKTLDELCARSPNMFCALGAGFPLHSYVFHPSDEIVWVRRASDSFGRIFLNRPRLNADLTPLEESQLRFSERDSLYAEHADWIYWLPEGLTAPCEFERQIWGDRLEDCGGMLTLRKEHFRNPRVFKNRLAKMGVDAFELRNDLLNSVELEMALAFLPRSKILVSLRQSSMSEDWRSACDIASQIDWALELGEPKENIQASCVSLHEESSLEAAASRLQKYEKEGLQVKWSPLVETFSEIEKGLQWQSEKSDVRSFLPRSRNGRWTWVRLLLKDRQRFNFFRDGEGSALDQPTLHEWIRALSRPSGFAAVLGEPVTHSYSPIEHLLYARHRQMSFVAVEVSESEWDEAFPVLKNIGLRMAAVTAPLKKKAFESAETKSPVALELHSANTLTLEGTGFRAHNTDEGGFHEMISGCSELGATVIWGGGGTLSALRRVLPEAQAVSVRTRKPRDPAQNLMERPETVIWAASPDADLPPITWRPRQILDLNYRDDSRAKEYAEKTGANYVSGLVMFRSQAALQREEWESHG